MSETTVHLYDRLEIVVYFKQYKGYYANEFRRMLGGLRQYKFVENVNDLLKEFNAEIIPKDYALIKQVSFQDDNSENPTKPNGEKREREKGKAKGGIEIYDAIGINSSNKEMVKAAIDGVMDKKYKSFKEQSLYFEIQLSEVL